MSLREESEITNMTTWIFSSRTREQDDVLTSVVAPDFGTGWILATEVLSVAGYTLPEGCDTYGFETKSRLLFDDPAYQGVITPEQYSEMRSRHLAQLRVWREQGAIQQEVAAREDNHVQ